MDYLSPREKYLETLAGEWYLIDQAPYRQLSGEWYLIDQAPYRQLAGEWELIKREKGFSDFSGWPILLTVLGGFFTTAGMWLWTKLTEAKTDSEREGVKADAYEAYLKGDIDRDLYESILGYSGNTLGDTFSYIAKKYGLYILGGAGLILLLVLMRKR